MGGLAFFGLSNPIILVLIFGSFIWSMIAQVRVKSAYRKYSQIRNMRGLTGHEVARYILDKNGLSNVTIARAQGMLSDHYDPRANQVRLSSGVYDGNSIASASIAAHEVGHAIQYAQNYGFIGIRNILLPTVVASSRFVGFIFIAGILLTSLSGVGAFLMDIAILLYLAVVIFQTLTLPIEFDASHRAKIQLDELGLILDGEKEGVQKVLGAAAMTYVAALAVTVTQLIRMILIRNSYRD